MGWHRKQLVIVDKDLGVVAGRGCSVEDIKKGYRIGQAIDFTYIACQAVGIIDSYQVVGIVNFACQGTAVVIVGPKLGCFEV